MKEAKCYAPPEMVLLEVAIEQGFFASEVTIGGWNEGGSLGDYDID